MARPDPLSRDLVDAALELHRRKLWLEIEGDAPFLVRVPGEEHALVASVMGQAGIEYGLSLFRGPGELARLARWIARGEGSPEESEEASILGVTVVPLGAIPSDMRGPLQAAGFQARREALAPHFLAKPAHHLARPPNRGEMRLLLYALRGVLAAHDAGELEPRSIARGPRRVLEITVEGDARKPTVATRTIPMPAPVETAPAALPARLRGDFSSLPRLDERWVVALPPLPASIEGEERAPRGLMVLDEGSGLVLGIDVVLGAGVEEVAAKLSELFRGERLKEPRERERGRRPRETERRGLPREQERRGLPREVLFTSERMAESLREALEALGVSVACEPDHAAIEHAVSEMGAFFGRGGRPAKAPGVPAAVLREALPETLEEWKEADRAFTERMCEEIDAGDVWTSRALARYFGSAKLGATVQEELADFEPGGAYIEWFAADYRVTARSRTFLERVLREGRWSEAGSGRAAAGRKGSALPRALSAAERALVEARLSAELSIYRVDSTEAGSTLEVEDVLTGARATVHDRAMSGCGLEGCFVPMRLFKAGRFTFPAIAGPPLSALDIGRALEHLEALGLDIASSSSVTQTPPASGKEAGGPRRSAHLFGRLWDFELQRRRNPPKLRNTDGDPLEWNTASFRVADVALLARELGARKDVERGTDAGSWTWFREGGPAPGFGETTILGELQVIDDRVVLEVNSARRLARAREWLERIPGVRFESARSREFSSKELPLDDRLRGPRPKPLPPKVLAEVGKALQKACRAWLDESIPALGGRTPREACASDEGRKRVAVLLRTMPPMAVPGGIVPAPVPMLMKELGIQSSS